MAFLKKILVTGGLGYIGSHTVIELVQAGFEPVIIDNFSNTDAMIRHGVEKILQKTVPVYQIDCTDYPALKSLFKSQRFHGVIHFASLKNVNESISQPLCYYRNNLNSLMTLMQVMGECNISNLVFSSSCAVYGDAEVLPVKECSPVLFPKSPYGNTKKICEEIIFDQYKSNTGFRSVILRYFNPIGAHPSGEIGEYNPGEPANLLPILMMHALSGKGEFNIHGIHHNTPDGTCVRDFIHICDLAKSHVRAFQYLDNDTLPSNYHDIFNIGTGKGYSILEFIKKFETVTARSLKYKVGPPRPGDISNMYADAHKAWKILGWKAEKTIEEAIVDAWRWQTRKAVLKTTAVIRCILRCMY
jgi:UDP-glucose 4-epimerase